MVLLVACLLMFLVPIIGLVVDCGLLYFVRSRLTSAADAAALAAARSLNLGLTVADQNSAAVARAQAFFNANFPAGAYGTSGTSVNVSLTQGNTPATLLTLYVTTQAQTSAPTYFMNIFNISRIPVKVNGQAARRNINLILVLDRSGSMANTQPGTSSTACDLMKSAAKNFVTYFANNRDRLALVTFESAWFNTFNQSQTFNPGINTAIDGISCSGGTNTSTALKQAYEKLKTINEPSALNVIVLFTDGQPSVLTCDFPVKMKRDKRRGDTASNYINPSAMYPAQGYMTTEYTVPPSPCKDQSGDQWYKNSGSPTYTNPAGPYNPNWKPFLIGNTGAGDTNNTIRGGLAYAGTLSATGYTYGLYGWDNNSATITTSGGCAFQQTASGFGLGSVRRDIAYVPATDIWGNSTTGFRTNWVYPTWGDFSGNDKFTSNTESSYNNQIRPDSGQAVGNAAYNVTDAQASTIRADTNLNPVIYTIGLGGNDSYGVDTELLIRVANVVSATNASGTLISNPIYSPTQGQGMYVYAPNSTQLSQAFSLIASSVLRLSR